MKHKNLLNMLKKNTEFLSKVGNQVVLLGARIIELEKTLIKNIELKLKFIELDKERCDLEHIKLVIEYENQGIKNLKRLREVIE